MREIKLYGSLGNEFGIKHHFDVKSVPEALQALAANYPKILDKMRHGFFKVVVGKNQKTGVAMDENSIVTYALGDQTLHIIPVTKGSKKGLGKVLAGILLIGLAVFTGGTSLMATGILGSTTTLGGIITSIGTGLVLTGVSSLLAPEQKTGETEQSFTMSGPQVTLREGGIVPIAYGLVWTGGTMISGVLKIENALAV